MFFARRQRETGSWASPSQNFDETRARACDWQLRRADAAGICPVADQWPALPSPVLVRAWQYWQSAKKFLYRTYAKRVVSMSWLSFDPKRDGATSFETM